MNCRVVVCLFVVVVFYSLSIIVFVFFVFPSASSSRFQQVVRSNRQPRLTVKLISHQKRDMYEQVPSLYAHAFFCCS